MRRHPDLIAVRTEDFQQLTEDYWVAGSGAGTAIGFSALLGLVVGVVIVGQTLYAVTREHLRELATLKAIGASDREIVGFVAWQAALLALLGGGIGLVLTLAVRSGHRPPRASPSWCSALSTPACLLGARRGRS